MLFGYRLTPHLSIELVNLLRHHTNDQRASAIPWHLQVLAVLRFLAEGSFQNGAASDFNHAMSQASLSRCIGKVLNALLQLQRQYIRFPETSEERRHVSQKYLNILTIGFKNYNNL